jgi:hypothetical protein
MSSQVEWGQFVELDLITSTNNRYYQQKQKQKQKQKHKQKYYHPYLQTIQEEQMQEEKQIQPNEQIQIQINEQIQIQPNEILTVSLPFSKKKMRIYMKKKSLFIYSSFTISLLCLMMIFYL